MTLCKVKPDIEKYWALMTKYNTAVSLVGKQYVLDVEMRRLLTEVENPRVQKLLSEFIQSKENQHV